MLAFVITIFCGVKSKIIYIYVHVTIIIHCKLWMKICLPFLFFQLIANVTTMCPYLLEFCLLLEDNPSPELPLDNRLVRPKARVFSHLQAERAVGCLGKEPSGTLPLLAATLALCSSWSCTVWGDFVHCSRVGTCVVCIPPRPQWCPAVGFKVNTFRLLSCSHYLVLCHQD